MKTEPPARIPKQHWSEFTALSIFRNMEISSRTHTCVWNWPLSVSFHFHFLDFFSFLFSYIFFFVFVVCTMMIVPFILFLPFSVFPHQIFFGYNMSLKCVLCGTVPLRYASKLLTVVDVDDIYVFGESLHENDIFFLRLKMQPLNAANFFLSSVWSFYLYECERLTSARGIAKVQTKHSKLT